MFVCWLVSEPRVCSLRLFPGEQYDPSFYELEKDEEKVCLATGFSAFDQLVNTTGFKVTEPARISQDSLFNQVSHSNCTEGTEGGGSGPCEDTLQPGVFWCHLCVCVCCFVCFSSSSVSDCCDVVLQTRW